MATGRNTRPLTFLDGLTLILIAFKLAQVGEVATWSWWWVLSPLWISLAWYASMATVLRIIKRAEKKRSFR